MGRWGPVTKKKPKNPGSSTGSKAWLDGQLGITTYSMPSNAFGFNGTDRFADAGKVMPCSNSSIQWEDGGVPLPQGRLAPGNAAE